MSAQCMLSCQWQGWYSLPTKCQPKGFKGQQFSDNCERAGADLSGSVRRFFTLNFF